MAATDEPFGMTLSEFRNRVRREFGEDLHRASPATVREFLDQLSEDGHAARLSRVQYPMDNRISIEESAKSYEEVMRTFFARVLELPPGEAVQLLWAVSFDLSYALIEDQAAERIGHLFRAWDETGQPF